MEVGAFLEGDRAGAGDLAADMAVDDGRLGMDRAIAALWQVSEEATGIPLDVAGAQAAADT